MTNLFRKMLVLFLILGLAVPAFQPLTTVKAADGDVTFTILHTNDFHGQLEPVYTTVDNKDGTWSYSVSNPGGARVAKAIKDVRTAVGAGNLLVLDAGDMMQGSLLSNLNQGEPVIAYYKSVGYNAATFGNHEFDWGQTVLGDRIAQAEGDPNPMQMIAANITKKNSDGSCSWEPFNASVTPYEIFTVGASPVKVGVIGVSSVETPYITVATATAGMCFRDSTEAILHYYDEVKAAADVLVVVSHNGLNDGGYGYGFPVLGDNTIAKNLINAGKPVSMIIGGHSHTNMTAASVVTVSGKPGSITVAQAYYNGRRVGRADFTYNTVSKTTNVAWSVITPYNTAKITEATPPASFDYTKLGAWDADTATLISGFANDPDYLALINQEIGYSQVDLVRNYFGDNMMSDLVNDAIYNQLNSDDDNTNNVDMVFNNAGGLRADVCATSPCNPGVVLDNPFLLTYGKMFSILPFGNATAVGDMQGTKILELLNQSATLFKGALQVSGIHFKFYRYADMTNAKGDRAAGYVWAWGAYDVQVYDKATDTWKPLDLTKTYKVATNEFLAPAGQDGYTPFKYMTNITYWGDMLNLVNDYVTANFATEATAYKGPNEDGTLDARVAEDGNKDDVYDEGEIIPVTILHHNDSHGRLLPVGSYQGYDQLVTLINKNRALNPDRSLLLSGGDNIQGDSMMYYFKSAGLGYAADGTPLPADMQINPLVKAFNAMAYDAVLLGNHEFNFGSEIFTSSLSKATFPILMANVSEDSANPYGLEAVGVKPYQEITLADNVTVAILGIGNHRVPNYELPSNIPGLTFTNPITTGQELAPGLKETHDVVVALTHIGFTEDPKSVEVDSNVDTNFAAVVPGVDVVVGSHSHTNPSTGFGAYKYLPSFVVGPDKNPVLVGQAYRYNTFLGRMALGLDPTTHEVLSEAGDALAVTGLTGTTPTPEDTTIKNIVQPYADMLADYNNLVIGSTKAPLNTTDPNAYIAETNTANLQADASLWKLNTALPADERPVFHISGAMTQASTIAPSATEASPVELKVSDMFSLMPYENSLLVMKLNGPELKAILERAYRNYYYYKYVPGYGGYSHYTTCMIDINQLGNITYAETTPALPNGHNVLSLSYDDNGTTKNVDFTDPDTFYNVSTVNYLAAGSCNFNNGGVSLFPVTDPTRIVADTQFYVRDAVIEYIQDQGTINPQVEGRLTFLQQLLQWLPRIGQQ